MKLKEYVGNMPWLWDMRVTNLFTKEVVYYGKVRERDKLDKKIGERECISIRKKYNEKVVEVIVKQTSFQQDGCGRGYACPSDVYLGDASVREM